MYVYGMDKLIDNSSDTHKNNNDKFGYHPPSPFLVKDSFEAHIAGWNDRVEVDGDGEEEEENRRVVTIARSIFIFPI